jgi:hypothetical protein
MTSLSGTMINKGLAVQTGTTGGGGGGGSSGGTVVVSGSAVTIDTVPELNASTISDGVNYIRTAGFYTVGDPGAGAWRRKTSGEPDVAGDQTSNGGTVRWEIIVEKGALQFFQFGAQGMLDYGTEPAVGAIDDAYRYMLMADKYIYQKNLGGIILDMPSQVIYFSKAHNMRRSNYHIRSGYHGVLFRNASYEDCFMFNYQYGNGHDYSLYMNNFLYHAGQACYKNSGQNAPGNVYRCYVEGVSAVSGDALTGSDPNATYTNGTAQFKYETYIGPNGTNPYDYYLGIDRSAANSCIENAQFWSFWENQSSDPNRNKWPDQHGRPGQGQFNCAIVERVRIKLANIFVTQYPGHGIAIVADGDRDLTGPGNVNGFHNDHLALYFCGKAGLHIADADANAGITNYMDTASNGRYGYEEFSFLGNQMNMHQDAFSGNMSNGRKQYPPGCLYGGFAYIARLPLGGIDDWPAYINEVPGGSNHAWIKWGGDGTLVSGSWGSNYPDWTPTQRFEPGGGFASTNINARNVFCSMYIELGTMVSQPCVNTVVLGGLGQSIDYSRGAAIFVNNTWSFVSTSGNVNFANLSLGETSGAPTGAGNSFETRINRTGGSGQPWAYQYYNSTWNAVGGNRP